jgi:non-specific serine/threonine protein kinase
VRQLQRWLARARAALSRQDADAAGVSGEHLTPEQAVREALALELRSTPRWRADPLTRREHEVALLVADGADTRAIAEQLVISPKTARVHIERILSKLGLHSRAQLAAWAVRQAAAAALVDGYARGERSGVARLTRARSEVVRLTERASST